MTEGRDNKHSGRGGKEGKEERNGAGSCPKGQENPLSTKSQYGMCTWRIVKIAGGHPDYI